MTSYPASSDTSHDSTGSDNEDTPTKHIILYLIQDLLTLEHSVNDWIPLTLHGSNMPSVSQTATMWTRDNLICPEPTEHYKDPGR